MRLRPSPLHFGPAPRGGAPPAVVAVGVVIIAVQSLRLPIAAVERPYVIVVGLDSLGSKLAELPVRDPAPNSDASFIQLASLAEKFWERPEALPVTLDSGSLSGRGSALYDSGSNQGFIAIRKLPATERGKCHHLWQLPTAAGRIREAGVLPAAGQTSGLYFFPVAPGGAGKLDRVDFFVTCEDASDPDSEQPRGKVMLGDRRI